jgi:hypothetical protein
MGRVRRYRRQPRRQGVVYGSVRPLEQDGGAGTIGRLLGAAVIVGAVGLLAAGAWVFLGRPSAVTPTPSPTSVPPSPSASPSASGSPTIGPSPSPTATATLPATPSPSPSPFTIEVREGPGAITFGTEYNENSLRITDPHTTFPPTGRFVWSAELTEAAGAPELTYRVLAYDPSTGSETLITEQTFEVKNQQATIFLRRQPMGRVVPGPGIYVLRYLRGDILLAEGYFEVADE